MKNISIIFLAFATAVSFSAQSTAQGVVRNDPSKAAPTAQPAQTVKAMELQMDFVVAPENAAAFEKIYSTVYVPAMRKQQGYLNSKFFRVYAPALTKKIEGEATDYNYQIQISFDTEENRMKWVGSKEHQAAWPAATKLAKSYKWRGFDVLGADNFK